MKKIFFFLGLPKTYIVKIQLVFQKMHRKLINTLRFMTYQKDCIWLLKKFRKNSYLEKCVQNSKKGWLYVTYDDRLSILGQRNSHTPLEIICSRYHPRFFDQDGHQTTSAYIENKHFFTISCQQTVSQYINRGCLEKKK